MPPWTETRGTAPVFLIEPLTTLPDAAAVKEWLRDSPFVKVVAIVGFGVDAEASEAARRLPYGIDGAGVEEIVFTRTVRGGEIVTFEDDAWPGEDRVYVSDDIDEVLRLAVRFAVSHDDAAELSAVIVTGPADFTRSMSALLD